MVFSDTTNLNGIIQEIEKLTGLGFGTISGDTTKLKEHTGNINNDNHLIWHTIFLSSGNWQYDDGNNTNLPQSATNLVSGTRKYALPSEALTVQRVEAKDTAGNFYQLKPITKEMVSSGLDEFYETSGTPIYYRLVNGTCEVFPAPNYNSTGGLKFYFDRDSIDFATSDTTKTPGFASPYHQILPLMSAIRWYKVNQSTSPTLPILIQDQLKLENSIKQFYARRWKDKPAVIGRAKESFK